MSKKITFATSNDAKVASVARVLGAYGITVEQAKIELPELQAESALEIACGKVRAAFAVVQAPVIVIDSSFCIRRLGGFPGTNVKWVTRQIGVQGYLDLMARFPDAKDRDCEMVDALAYLAPGMESPNVFMRYEKARVADDSRGSVRTVFKSILALIFVPQGETKTLAEMTDEELAAYRAKPLMESHLHALAAELAKP